MLVPYFDDHKNTNFDKHTILQPNPYITDP